MVGFWFVALLSIGLTLVINGTIARARAPAHHNQAASVWAIAAGCVLIAAAVHLALRGLG